MFLLPSSRLHPHHCGDVPVCLALTCGLRGGHQTHSLVLPTHLELGIHSNHQIFSGKFPNSWDFFFFPLLIILKLGAIP